MQKQTNKRSLKEYTTIGAHSGPFFEFLQRHTGITLWLIPIFTMFIVGGIFYFIGSEFILKYLLQLDNIPHTNNINIVIDIVYIVACLVFLWPIIAASKTYNKKIETDENLLQKARNRIINYPTFLILIVYCFWIIRVWNLYMIFPNDDKTLIPIIAVSLLATILSAMIQFYMADLQNRFMYIPYWFPDGEIKVSFRLLRSVSLVQRFMDLFFINGLFPIIVCCGIVFIVSLYGPHDPDEIYRTFITISVSGTIFLMFGLFMSILSAKTFIEPVKAMVWAADEMAKENYNIRVAVQSSDQLGLLQSSINRMAVELEEKKTIKTLFGHYVSTEIRDLILDGRINTKGDKIEAVILFSDIRGFTTLTEKYAPEKVIHLLNTHFGSIVQAVSDNQGFVDKFIGDAVMAVFDAELCENNHRQFALNAAMTILSGMAQTNKLLQEMELDCIEIGVGMACGDVIRGNIGAEDRRELTVVGDTVNIASRLESMTKEVGWPLVVTRNSVYLQNETVPGFNLERLEPLMLRGKTRIVEVFGLRPIDPNIISPN